MKPPTKAEAKKIREIIKKKYNGKLPEDLSDKELRELGLLPPIVPINKQIPKKKPKKKQSKIRVKLSKSYLENLKKKSKK